MPVPGPQLHRHGACSTAHLAERCRPFADVHLPSACRQAAPGNPSSHLQGMEYADDWYRMTRAGRQRTWSPRCGRGSSVAAVGPVAPAALLEVGRVVAAVVLVDLRGKFAVVGIAGGEHGVPSRLRGRPCLPTEKKVRQHAPVQVQAAPLEGGRWRG